MPLLTAYAMTQYFNEHEETLGKNELEELQLSKLQRLLGEILKSNSFYQAKLGGIKPASNNSLDALRDLPFTTKDELVDDQENHPPYGSNLTYPIDRYCRLHGTSGTSGGRVMRWLDTPESWEWVMKCWGIIYRAIGLEDNDRVFLPFSFGPFLGFWAAFEGAARLGNMVQPGGGMTSAARLNFMIENEATVIGCTPTYALRLAEVAAEEGVDIAASKIRAVIVAGEPGGNIPEMKQRIENAWGARCFDHTGMTEIGSLGIECVEDKGNTHLIASECIPEVIDPDSGEPVPEGESGELVLTVLGRWGSPLVRYRTGDLVRLTYERCKCGRNFPRMLGGILGRQDDMMFIRGNNIYPSAIEAVVRRFSGVAEFRMQQVSDGSLNSLKLDIEPAPSVDDPTSLGAEVKNAVKGQFNFRPEIEIVAHGSLPRFELKARRLVK